jgi:hypothetical protein
VAVGMFVAIISAMKATFFCFDCYRFLQDKRLFAFWLLPCHLFKSQKPKINVPFVWVVRDDVRLFNIMDL